MHTQRSDVQCLYTHQTVIADCNASYGDAARSSSSKTTDVGEVCSYRLCQWPTPIFTAATLATAAAFAVAALSNVRASIINAANAHKQGTYAHQSCCVPFVEQVRTAPLAPLHLTWLLKLSSKTAWRVLNAMARVCMCWSGTQYSFDINFKVNIEACWCVGDCYWCQRREDSVSGNAALLLLLLLLFKHAPLPAFLPHC